ncbi:hypothetical protein PRECH8_08080 [Insulibacter thermoxylanivorax]|uniref:Uncharacterized protein n=1 Tax=Insulibacter thermoxylanivorax TaxID=2749268 RepID=A0A916QFK8_9BACL|nr:hypothetical protein PRECH8_08080 [Insulibacter thermoxylanivorax]
MVTVEHHAETIKTIDSAVVTVEHHAETIETIDSVSVPPPLLLECCSNRVRISRASAIIE